MKAAWPAPLDGDPIGFATVIPFDLPFRQTEYYNADVRWAREFDEVVLSEVDLHNTVPAGQRIGIPVEVTTEAGAKTPRNKRLTIEVSFDDGQTWRRVPVITRAGQKLAMISHPDTPGNVSLRGSAVDVKGNSATITVIHPYRIA